MLTCTVPLSRTRVCPVSTLDQLLVQCLVRKDIGSTGMMDPLSRSKCPGCSSLTLSRLTKQFFLGSGFLVISSTSSQSITAALRVLILRLCFLAFQMTPVFLLLLLIWPRLLLPLPRRLSLRLCAYSCMPACLPPPLSLSLSSRDRVERCLSLPLAHPRPRPRPVFPSSPTAPLSRRALIESWSNVHDRVNRGFVPGGYIAPYEHMFPARPCLNTAHNRPC